MGFFKEFAKIFVKSSIIGAIVGYAKTKLDEQIRNQIINNVIKMIIFFSTIIINHFSLFGQNLSLFISSLIIVALLIHSAVCFIPKIIKLFKTLINYKIIPLIPMIFEGTSPSEIVAYYIFSWGSLAWKIKNKFNETVGEWVPDADELFGYVWVYIGKRFLIFIFTLGIYLVLFNLIVRPLILTSTMGVGLKVYLLPFFMAIDFIFKTEITQWIIS